MTERTEPEDPQRPADQAKALGEPTCVFFTYASIDKPAVDAVCAALERDGITCWVNVGNIQTDTSQRSGRS